MELKNTEKDHFIIDSNLYSLPGGMKVKIKRKEIGDSITMLSGVSQKDLLEVYYEYSLSWEYLEKEDRDKIIKLYNDAQKSKQEIIFMLRKEFADEGHSSFIEKRKCVLDNLKEGEPVIRNFFQKSWLYKDIEIEVL